MTRTCRLAIVLLAMVGPRNARAEHTNALYVEALGKGGLWGLGYDRRLERRITVGAVGSAQSLEGERYVSLSPYVGIYPVRAGRSAWFIDVGAQVAHVWSMSPVPEWPGESRSGVGAIGSTGYEMRDQLLFRLFAHGVVGKGGIFPWVGAGIGFTF